MLRPSVSPCGAGRKPGVGSGSQLRAEHTIPGRLPAILSRDGLQLYIASNRPNGKDLNIWVAERTSADGPFGAPVNMGAPINGSDNDFCPSPLRDGHGIYVRFQRPGVVEGLTFT